MTLRLSADVPVVGLAFVSVTFESSTDVPPVVLDFGSNSFVLYTFLPVEAPSSFSLLADGAVVIVYLGSSTGIINLGMTSSATFGF